MINHSIFNDDIEFFQRMTWRKIIVIGFLLMQLVLIFQARFIEERYFCWAPHDYQVEYDMTVIVNGRELTPKEIYQRFHRDKKYREVRSAGNIKSMVIQHGQTYGRNDDTMVTVEYKINGKQQEPWIWHSTPHTQ